MPWERPHGKAFPWPVFLPLPSCPDREQVPMVWDHPNPSPNISRALGPPGKSPLAHVPTKGDGPHQAPLFPCLSPATSSLPLRRPSWHMGWGLTHLPRSHHCPWCAQPTPACLCLAPGGAQGCCWSKPLPGAGWHPEKSSTERLGVQLSPRGRGWKGHPQTVILPSLSPRRCAPRSAHSWSKPRPGAPGDCSYSLGTERVVGAGQQCPLPSLTPRQWRPPKTPLVFLQPAGSQGARAGGCPPKYPCGVQGAAGRVGQGRGRRVRDLVQRVGYSCEDRSRGWGWGPRAGRGVGLQAGAARPGDTLPLDPCNAAQGWRMQNPPLSPHPHPELPLPSSGDGGSSASSPCCSLQREAWVNPKETLAAEAASHPLCPPPAATAPLHGMLLWTWVLSEHPLQPAPSLSPLSLARVQQPPPLPQPPQSRHRGARRSRFQPAMSHQPTAVLLFSTLFFSFFFALTAKRTLLRAGLFPGTTTNPAAGRARAPSHVIATGTTGLSTRSYPPPKVHRDALATPKPCPGCKVVRQLCSIPARWGRGCRRTPGMAGHLRMEIQGLICKQPSVASCWSSAPIWERV